VLVQVITVNKLKMYDSDEEYSFVVLSRVNSLRKVRLFTRYGKNPKLLANSRGNLSVVSMKTKLFCYIKSATGDCFFSFLSLCSVSQPASYGKKVSKPVKNNWTNQLEIF
jgi:hypothetical protein